jgi:hypothetical protein
MINKFLNVTVFQSSKRKNLKDKANIINQIIRIYYEQHM